MTYNDPKYLITERNPTFEIIITTHPEYHRQIWAGARMTIRHKNDTCILCGKVVGKRALRPITNLSNRMYRICLAHLDEA